MQYLLYTSILPNLRPQYGNQAIAALLSHYAAPKPAEKLPGETTSTEAIITSETVTEWKTYLQLLVNKPESSMKIQLQELGPTKC